MVSAPSHKARPKQQLWEAGAVPGIIFLQMPSYLDLAVVLDKSKEKHKIIGHTKEKLRVLNYIYMYILLILPLNTSTGEWSVHIIHCPSTSQSNSTEILPVASAGSGTAVATCGISVASAHSGIAVVVCDSLRQPVSCLWNLYLFTCWCQVPGHATDMPQVATAVPLRCHYVPMLLGGSCCRSVKVW